LRLLHQNEKVFRSHTALPSKYKEKSIDEFESHLKEMGIDPTIAGERVRERERSRSRSRSRSESRVGRKRSRSESKGPDSIEKEQRASKMRRAASRTPRPGEGLSITQKAKAEALAHRAMYERGKDARKGEGDRTIYDLKPKHLFAGKRKAGKTDRR